MSKATAFGLARIQSESRIPASTWRDLCNRLELDPHLAVEGWDEVCNPIRTATGKAPDVTLILLLRAARPDHYIDDFRDELPSILPGEFTFRRLVLAICDGKVRLEDLLILVRKKLPNHVAEDEYDVEVK